MESLEQINLKIPKESAICSIGIIHQMPDGYNRSYFNIVFDDKTSLSLFDYGQYCCEHRYMHTDDDLKSFNGARVSRIYIVEVQAKKNVGEDDCDNYDDIQFLKIETSEGDITITSHNEHNGYYGGFDIVGDMKKMEIKND